MLKSRPRSIWLHNIYIDISDQCPIVWDTGRINPIASAGAGPIGLDSGKRNSQAAGSRIGPGVRVWIRSGGIVRRSYDRYRSHERLGQRQYDNQGHHE